LQHLDIVERFLENHKAVGLADLADQIFPGVVREGAADHDLQIGFDLPQLQVVWTPSIPEGIRMSTKARA